jgi:hypothetical protein
MKGEKVDGVPSKQSILDYTLKKINYHLSRNASNEKDIYEVYKYFFSNYYDLKYEFSTNELAEELDKLYIEAKVKQYYLYIASRISLIEYKDNSLTEKEIKEIFEVMKQVIEYLIKTDKTHKKTFVQKVKLLFTKN